VVSLTGTRAGFRLGAWTGSSRNDFRFVNEKAPGGSVTERRSNASFSAGGMTGDMAYRQGSSLLTAHIWYNDSDRELPGPVTTVQQDFGERQTDRSLRGVVKFSAEKGKLSAGIMTGITGERNRYYHQVPGYNGDNTSSSFTARVRLGYRITGKTGLVLHAGEVAESAGSLGYEKREARNIFSASLGARSNPFPGLNLLLQVRQMVVSDMKVSPEFTAGTAWMLSASGDHLLRASFSRNIKLPCLNDLYWIPGGNSSLLPEKSTGGEISWSFVRLESVGNRSTADIAIHTSRVNDMIQWIPGQSGIWHAVNLRSVNVTGAEARAGRESAINEWRLSGYLNYAFTRSVIAGSDIPNDRSVGRQLIYAPLHQANLNLGVARKWFTSGMAAGWESRRYTTSDNSEWLPASLMTDVSAGAVISAGKASLTGELKVNNIFNIPSESVRNYPMPLRTINLKLTLTWSDKTKKNEDNL
jgi:iron complex outermembrane receptor protein